MNSSRPYLLRAMYDWIVDNGMTPHILVNASAVGVHVPAAQIKDDKIVLNISPGAVRGMDLGKSHISFSARFGGAPFSVNVPVDAVLAVYARENGKGMLFPESEDAAEEDQGIPPPGGRRSHLTIVK
ncbi:MAG: ClpXP protease specificity-enhancing factor [Gammaproteobacteria bacterium]|nr:MAG: ClpXP protease specificity-enhancing factor [Gammaproteobacteria bacterium]